MNSTPNFVLLLILLVLTHPVYSAHTVKFLPGFEGPLPFELETGYIGIGEKEEIQSFYYFIKSEKNPEEDPLLLWLNGGPGCSSLEGLFFENGPVAFKVEVYNGTVPTLVSTTYSWTKVANIIFLDQPVGAGFSYYKTPRVENVSDTGEAKRIHEFIQKWLRKHPQFHSNPFYVTGDSYSGMTIPATIQEISKGNYICCEPPINLQGYMLGDPITNIEYDENSRVLFSHGMGLISDELYESLTRICKGKYENADPENKECLKLVEEYHKCTDKINTQHTLMPDCDGKKVVPTSPDCYYYVYYIIEYWANDESVREALQVRKGTVKDWVRCNWGLPYNHDIKSSVPYHKNNSITGYRSLIYSGDHDITMPFQATQAWIKSLNYSIIDDWRPWMVKDQIGGYTRTYSNKMTYATIKGGGHTVEYKPMESSIMIKRWITGQPL